MKYKKYVLGLLFGLVVFMGGNLAHASAYSVYWQDDAHTYTADDHNCIRPYSQSMCNTGYATPTQNGELVWWVMSGAEYPYESFDIQVMNMTISGITEMATRTAGIGLFKAPTDTGYATSYKSTDMINQTASALQSTMGLEGLGTIIAIIGGMILAFGIILWIVNLFNEVKVVDKTKNTGKKV